MTCVELLQLRTSQASVRVGSAHPSRLSKLISSKTLCSTAAAAPPRSGMHFAVTRRRQKRPGGYDTPGVGATLCRAAM
eukprot:350891-Chlamydomonas_euryale.AAC.2